MSDEEDVQVRAARARQLLEDETLLEALNGVSQDVANLLLVTDLRDASACIAAVAAAQATKDFELKLRQFITSGRATQRKPHVVA